MEKKWTGWAENNNVYPLNGSGME